MPRLAGQRPARLAHLAARVTDDVDPRLTVPVHPSPAAGHDTSFVLWALNAKVKRWLPLIGGLNSQAAADEMSVRQGRVRRSGQPCVFKVLPEGAVPH